MAAIDESVGDPADAGYRRATARLLAVCLDQALHELVDIARLGQVALVQQVAQLGLGQTLVALAGLVMGVPGCLRALRACSFSACSACSRAVCSALPACSCAKSRADSACSRTRPPTGSACSRTAPGRR